MGIYTDDCGKGLHNKCHSGILECDCVCHASLTASEKYKLRMFLKEQESNTTARVIE